MTIKELLLLDKKYKDFKMPYNVDSIDVVKKIYDSLDNEESVRSRIENLPAKFVLQRHWIKEKLDGSKKTNTSEHFDIRVKVDKKDSWFGFALKKDPRLMDIGEKTIAPPKGGEFTPANIANMYWFNVDYDEFDPGEPGNWTVNYRTAIKRVDKGRAKIIRREKDFFEIIFYGKTLRGRWFFRQIDNGDKKFWLAWRSKDQDINEEDVAKSLLLAKSYLYQSEKEFADALVEFRTKFSLWRELDNE